MQHDPTETPITDPGPHFYGPYWDHPEAAAYFAGDLDQASKAELVQELHVAIDDLAAAPAAVDLREQGQRVGQLTARVEYARDLELARDRTAWPTPEPAWSSPAAEPERGWSR
jgi:hypothetical protein